MSIDAVPSRPAREWLSAWAVMTGDPANLIAAGFDLDPSFVAELIGSEPPRLIGLETARLLCERLRAEPLELWTSQHAMKLGTPTWPTEPLWAEVAPVRWRGERASASTGTETAPVLHSAALWTTHRRSEADQANGRPAT